MSVEYTTDNYTLQAGNTTPISNPITCKICGKPVPHGSDRVLVGRYPTEYFVCKECAEEHLMQCSDCGDWYDPSELTTVANGDVVCNKCLEKSYERCTDCDEYGIRPTDDDGYDYDYIRGYDYSDRDDGALSPKAQAAYDLLMRRD